MDIIIFLLGVIVGALIVFFVQKNSKNSSNETLEQMKLYFENIATKVCSENSKELTSQNKEKLEEFFLKFKEKIEDFEKRTETKFKQENENFTKFDENIKTFINAGQKISMDTESIIKTMKSDNRAQGAWGEIVLERVLESSGLRKNEEYLIQSSTDSGRPDAIVVLPDNKFTAIDAKTSLASFFEYVNASDDVTQKTALENFKDSTKRHIDGLKKRDYSEFEGKTSADYVLMFIPVESCYSLMFCEDCKLWEYAWKNKIMPVSPSTLLATLKIINATLVTDRQNKNSLEIAKLCTTMLDKFVEMVKNLTSAQKNLNDALVKLDGRGSIISTIQKLQEKGATSNKEIPYLEIDN